MMSSTRESRATGAWNVRGPATGDCKSWRDVDPQLARIVELRYFAGLSELQIAELTERSERSVRRDWQKARMFLLQMLQGK